MKSRWWVLGFALWTILVAGLVWAYRDAAGTRWREQARAAIVDSTTRILVDSLEAEADSVLAGARRRDSALLATIATAAGSNQRLRASVARSARLSDSLTRVLATVEGAAERVPILEAIVVHQESQIVGLTLAGVADSVALQDARAGILAAQADRDTIRARGMEATARLRAEGDSLRTLLQRGIRQPSPNRSGVLGLLKDLSQRLGVSVGPGYLFTVQGEQRVGVGVFRAF